MESRDEGSAGAWLRRRAGGRLGTSSFACAWLWTAIAQAAPPDPDEGVEEVEAPAEASEPACDPETEACEEPEPSSAVEWYVRGYELGQAGDYAAAAEAFMRSYELQPTSDALFNAALAHENAGATIEAIETYERFLAEPDRKQEQVPAAEASIEALMREVAVLKGVRYEAEHPPVELWVAGRRIELDAFPLLLTPGEIQVEVVNGQGERASEIHELDAGEALVIDIRALIEVPAEPPAPDFEFVEAEGPSAAELEAREAQARRALALRRTTFVGLGLAGSAALAAVTLGALAQSTRYGPFEDETCYEFTDGECPPDFPVGDPGGTFARYQRYALATTISASVSAGLAATALVMGLVSLHYTRASKGRSRRQTRVTSAAGGLVIGF